MNFKIRKLVENNLKKMLRFALVILLFTTVLSACDDSNELGLEVLPSGDLISVHEVLIQDDIWAYTEREDGLISSGGTSLIGSLNDPSFGSTDIEFAAQYRLQYYPDFGSNPEIDSVKLILFYKGVYGDTITPQNFKVYELAEDLDVDEDYTQDIDLKAMAYDDLLGELTMVPKVEIDSTRGDSIFQTMTVHLDNSLGEKLVALDSTILSNNDSLLTRFKGLFVETQPIRGELGSILTLNTSSSSHLKVYYNNDENKGEEEPDTLFVPFVISDNSARVNSIEHDYWGTPSQPSLEQKENIYIQPTGGLKALINIDNLERWRDSVNIGINKIELVFQTDTIASDIENFPPPEQLLLTFIDDEGNEKIPSDYFFSPTFFGGFLNEDYEYRFNITQHMQYLLDGHVDNNGFYLSTGRRTPYANRVILEGKNKGAGFKLYITYSKYAQ